MARDLTIPVREFYVASMGAAADIAALVGSPPDARVWGPSVPAKPVWPFIRTDLPVVTPDPDAGCGGGSRYAFNIHGFAKGKDERAAGALAAAIVAHVDELTGALDVDPVATITDTVWTSTQIFRDTAEVEGWHAVVSVYARVAG